MSACCGGVCRQIDPVVSLVDQLDSLREMMALAQEEKETAVQAECLERMVELADDAHRLQLQTLLCTCEGQGVGDAVRKML